MKTLKKLTFCTLVLVGVVALAGCEKDFGTGYTYNDYSSLSPKTWNVHSWETNTDSYIISYTEMGLYDLILDEAATGYEFVPEMAAAFPVDVTDQFTGKYNVPATVESGDVWAVKIALNDKATWANGDPINAETYVNSMKHQLDPDMQNRRADSYYDGRLKLANAKGYIKAGQFALEPVVYADENDKPVYDTVPQAEWLFDYSASNYFFGQSMRGYFVDNGLETNPAFLDGDDKFILEAYKTGEHEVTEELKAILTTIAVAFGDSGENAWKEFFCSYVEYPELDFSEVGIIKSGEYEITLVLDQKITDFNLKYSLSSNWIVHEATYERTLATVAGIKATKYGTTVGNYMSYGPYKLTKYQTDKEIVMDRNEAWYGYTDGKHENQFQTTRIKTKIIKDQATALMGFQKGELDGIALTNADMEIYKGSSRLVITPESYTQKLTFNTDIEKLGTRESAGIVKRIFANQDFRQSLSLAIDRAKYASEHTASGQPGFGLINNLYLYDPDHGTSYRSAEVAKQALLDVYKETDYDKLSGYNIVEARRLMKAAVDAEVAAGRLKSGDRVEIEFLLSNIDQPSIINAISYLEGCLNTAAEGTILEGKISIKMKLDENYYETALVGDFDMIWAIWGGAAMDPFGMTEVYTHPELLNEYGFGPDIRKFSVELPDGEGNPVVVEKTFTAWHEALNSGEYVGSPYEIKLMILAAFEKAFLETYCTIPVIYRATAALDSFRVEFKAENYVPNVGFGGIRFMTFTHNDTEWENFCKEHKRNLPYGA